MWPRALAASTIGTTIEWYDFFLYGIVAALVFPRLFFPESDPFTGTLLAFSTYFVGFAARPVGGIVFGHVGDRLGRKASLVATMLLMGAATVGIGLVPGYDTIGIWGGVLLVVGRVLQGIGVGGEWGGSILLAGEWADPDRRGFAMSWPQWGGPAGLLLANGALGLMAGLTTEEQFAAWGWRVPFLASVALIAVGLYIRVGILETPVFARLRTRGRVRKAPVVEVMRHNWRDPAGGVHAHRPDGAILHLRHLHPGVLHAAARSRPRHPAQPRDAERGRVAVRHTVVGAPLGPLRAYSLESICPACRSES